mmetsp:Transcript_29294/g.28038  ORF Transcript_29294/g.28038 Transcript_29294/m.28038 type:complete len:346 (+) Transcript_29294:190-1227(+)
MDDDDLGDFFSEINQIDDVPPEEKAEIKVDDAPFQGTITSTFVASKKQVVELPKKQVVELPRNNTSHGSSSSSSSSNIGSHDNSLAKKIIPESISEKPLEPSYVHNAPEAQKPAMEIQKPVIESRSIPQYVYDNDTKLFSAVEEEEEGYKHSAGPIGPQMGSTVQNIGPQMGPSVSSYSHPTAVVQHPPTSTLNLSLHSTASSWTGTSTAAPPMPKSTKTFIRTGAGEIWTDDSLKDWPDNDYRIFVGDLGKETTTEMLAKIFQPYKSFAKAKVIRTKAENKARGFGFVSFMDPMDCAKAIREMQGKYLGTRPMKITRSKWDDLDIKNVKKKEAKKRKVQESLGL